MNINDVDLNLLKVFDALWRKRSVTLAGDAMGLSQPAMSFALSKLRLLFDDVLFMRSAQGMQPTARAQELAGPVQRILEIVGNDILPASHFSAAQSDRQFVLCMSDIGEMVFLPRLAHLLATRAPRVSIKTMALAGEELEQALAAGSVDAVVGYFPELLSSAIRNRPLYSHSFVALVRQDHPTIGDHLTEAQYMEADHIAVHAEGRGASVLERELARLRVERKVRFALPRFVGIPLLVAESDMVATVPLAVARRFAENGRVRIVALPWEIPGYDIYLHWHGRFHHDPANCWLRELLEGVVVQMRTSGAARH